MELYFNAEFYANREIFKVTEQHSEIPESVLFSVALSKDGDRTLTAGDSYAAAVKAEALAGCEDKNWSCLLHLMALASVLRRPINSLYHNVQFRFRSLLHNVLQPRLSPLNDEMARPENAMSGDTRVFFEYLTILNEIVQKFPFLRSSVF